MRYGIIIQRQGVQERSSRSVDARATGAYVVNSSAQKCHQEGGSGVSGCHSQIVACRLQHAHTAVCMYYGFVYQTDTSFQTRGRIV